MYRTLCTQKGWARKNPTDSWRDTFATQHRAVQAWFQRSHNHAPSVVPMDVATWGAILDFHLK